MEPRDIRATIRPTRNEEGRGEYYTYLTCFESLGATYTAAILATIN